MLKSILYLLVATVVAAPLFAGDSVDAVFEKQAAEAWYKRFQQWVVERCDQDGSIESWFPDAKDLPRHYRIEAVKDGKLVAREIVSDNGGKKALSAKTTSFEWKDWQPRFIAVVYPVLTNNDVEDVYAFAAWLYLHANDPLVADRVLTVIYDRDNERQNAIAAYIARHHGWKDSEELAVGEVWDGLFQTWRRVLMRRDDAENLEKRRKSDSQDSVTALLDEYADASKRKHSLKEIEYLFKEWQAKFGDTDAYRKFKDNVEDTRAAIAEDQKKIDVHLELASKCGKNELGTKADFFDKALALDPCSISLLSKAANAWLKYGNPELRRNRWICTHEDGVKKARDRYERWLERDADNVELMKQLVVCYKVLGQNGKAAKLQKRIDKLG